MGAALSSCTSFPQLHPHILSLHNGLCGEYEVVKQIDACTIEYKFKAWHPLAECEGFFAIPASDVSALLEYQTKMCSGK